MELNVIHNCDAITGMKHEIDDHSVDLIVTDPPFAIGFDGKQANYNRKKENVIKGYEEIEVKDYDDFTVKWITQAKRILKETGSMFVVSGWNNLNVILSAAKAAGFIQVNHIIWKYQFGVNCTKRFVTSHYHILYFCVNDKKRKFFTNCRFEKDEKIGFTNKSARYADMEDVWIIPRENWTGMEKTATKLPGELIRKILAYTGEPGDLVVDPFSGSGQVAWFVKKHNMNYICFEKVDEIFDFSKRRMDDGRYLIPKEKEVVV